MVQNVVKAPHKLSVCEMCGEHVVCGYCGNNCCNGGTGTLPDGTECGCDEAYAAQDEYFKDLAWSSRDDKKDTKKQP